MPVSSWSTTAADNGSTLGIDIAENCAAANVNNAIRELMAQVKDKFDSVDGTVGSGSFQPLDATLTAWAGLATAADKLGYWSGSDTASLTDFTSFGRTLVALGDANALAALISVISLSSVTFGTNTISLSLVLSASHTLLIQGGTGSVAADTADTITFPTAYSTAPVCIVSGGSSNASHEGDVHPSSAASTTGITIMNSNGSATCTYTWLALGKA
jgi:hypothetical protein